MIARRARAAFLAVAATTALTACSSSDSGEATSAGTRNDNSATTSPSDSSTSDASANACLAVGQALPSSRIPIAADIPSLTEIDTVKFVAGESADFVGVLRTSGAVADSVDAVKEGLLQVAS